MQKSDLSFVIKSFLIWRIGLFLVLFLAVKFIPLQQHFLGGGMTNYLKAPWLWAWANFDGEHYLSIAKVGYANGEQAFFPLYPLLIRLFGGGVGVGLLISNFFFLLALVGLSKLILLDWNRKIAKTVTVLLLLFPASFYFGGVYTESLFLALTVWSFYLVRRQKWFWASILGAVASATRIIGILLLPTLAVRKRSFWLLVIPIGLVAYMFYLNQTAGDPFKFLHTLPGFGEQRSAIPILLPQVFYRYLVKILPNLNYGYFPVVFTTLTELAVGTVFLALSILAFFKLRPDYAVFLFLGYLTPTLSGSFSSLPRYVAVLFPAFILIALWVNKLSWLLKITVYGILAICLAISTALFVRGFWLA